MGEPTAGEERRSTVVGENAQRQIQGAQPGKERGCHYSVHNSVLNLTVPQAEMLTVATPRPIQWSNGADKHVLPGGNCNSVPPRIPNSTNLGNAARIGVTSDC